MRSIPLVEVHSDGEVVSRFWPKGYHHANTVAAWLNALFNREEKRGGTGGKTAKITAVVGTTDPWQAWEDNCRFEYFCLRYRGVGFRKIQRITKPGIDRYHGNPLTHDEFNDPLEEDGSLSLLG